MAAVISCDKCGVSSVKVSDFMHIRAYKLSSTETYSRRVEKYMDVCKDCYKNIFNTEEDNNNGN